VGEIESADALGVAQNSACGDILHLYLKIDDNRIVRASFKVFGCAAAIAAGSVLTEMVTGGTLEEMKAITKQAVVDALGGLPPMKVHCSVLAEDVIRAALDDYHSRQLHPTTISPG
jgi:nitrogen fixation NifU-like protein